jgi:hypothetical protein
MSCSDFDFANYADTNFTNFHEFTKTIFIRANS